jgi:uridylate kinase
MNIIKVGGSIVNPDGKYDPKVIKELMDVVKEIKEQFIFVIGGGRLCRKVQDAAKPYLEEALPPEEISLARDWLGIATTKINAGYILDRFREQLGDEVYAEIILDPTQKVNSKARIFFTGGWKPGCSTDKDMMLLAANYKADKVIKITDVEYVKRINPVKYSKLSFEEKGKVLAEAEDIKEINWQDFKELLGVKWQPGLNTPFDPVAVAQGYELKPTLYFGRRTELLKMLKDEPFTGTVVKK